MEELTGQSVSEVAKVDSKRPIFSVWSVIVSGTR